MRERHLKTFALVTIIYNILNMINYEYEFYNII